MREAIALVLKGEHEAALTLMARAPDPGEPRLLCHRARALHELGRVDEAREAMAIALHRGAGIAFVQETLALLAWDARRLEECAEAMRRWAELDRRNVLLPAYEALLFLEGGDRGQALRALEAALLPASPALQARVVVRLEELLGPGTVSFEPYVLEIEGPLVAREPAAFAALNRYLLWPDRAASWLHVRLFARHRRRELDALMAAGRAMDEGRPVDAEALLRAAADPAPPSDVLRLAHVEALLACGRSDEALASCEGEAHEDETYRLALRAAALFRLGRAEECARLLEERVAEATARDHAVGYLLGLARLQSGDREGSRRAFASALSLEGAPFAARALVKVARLRLE